MHLPILGNDKVTMAKKVFVIDAAKCNGEEVSFGIGDGLDRVP